MLLDLSAEGSGPRLGIVVALGASGAMLVVMLRGSPRMESRQTPSSGNERSKAPSGMLEAMSKHRATQREA